MHLEILWENGTRNTVTGDPDWLWELGYQLVDDDRVDVWELRDVELEDWQDIRG